MKPLIVADSMFPPWPGAKVKLSTYMHRKDNPMADPDPTDDFKIERIDVWALLRACAQAELQRVASESASRQWDEFCAAIDAEKATEQTKPNPQVPSLSWEQYLDLCYLARFGHEREKARAAAVAPHVGEPDEAA